MRLVALAAVVLGLATIGCGADGPKFDGQTEPVRRELLRASWRPGCPVPVDQLRLVRLSYWGFDGDVHRGELVLHEAVAEDMLGVFRRLFEARFPIARMRLVDAYGGDDERSMAANNTSAFNCRLVSDTGRWSEHAYGRAVDINPVQNPIVFSGGKVLPTAGARYARRSQRAPGMIHAGDEVVHAFASIGWSWGGSFRSAKDYQHFSATGR